jgi:hypothetical protein
MLKEGCFQLFLLQARAGFLKRMAEMRAPRSSALEAFDKWKETQTIESYTDGTLLLSTWPSITALLGHGSHGVVFAANTLLWGACAVKLAPSSKGGACMRHEFHMQTYFAQSDLAWRPHGVLLSALGTGLVEALYMPRVDGTLEELLAEGADLLAITSQLSCLLDTARKVECVHMDAKCNNIGFLRNPLQIRFMDCGLAFTRGCLEKGGLSTSKATQALEIGYALDTARLCSSLKRKVRRASAASPPWARQCEALIELLQARVQSELPLEEYIQERAQALKLLRRARP